MGFLLIVSLILNIGLVVLLNEEVNDNIRLLRAFRTYIAGDEEKSLRILSGKEE